MKVTIVTSMSELYFLDQWVMFRKFMKVTIVTSTSELYFLDQWVMFRKFMKVTIVTSMPNGEKIKRQKHNFKLDNNVLKG